nr:hypothetical protein [Tanacetum cinerariifolium]
MSQLQHSQLRGRVKVSEEMIRCMSEVEEAVRMISSTYSSKLGGGGGGGVIGGVGVVCGDAVDSGVRGVVCGVKALISMMIVSVLEKDRWFGTGGRDGIVDGCGGDDIKHDTSNVRFESYRYEMKGEKLLHGPRSVLANFACSEEMIRCMSEVEEAVRMISSPYSSWGGGGGGGVIDGVGVFCGDAVDSEVGGVVFGVVCEFVCGFICVVVKALISMMIVSVLEKDRWFGTRGRDDIVDGGGGDDIKRIKNINSDLRKGHSILYPLMLETGDVQRHDTSNVRFEGYRYEMKGEKLLQYPYTVADHKKP